MKRTLTINVPPNKSKKAEEIQNLIEWKWKNHSIDRQRVFSRGVSDCCVEIVDPCSTDMRLKIVIVVRFERNIRLPVNQKRWRGSISPKRDSSSSPVPVSIEWRNPSDASRWFLCWSYLSISMASEIQYHNQSLRTSCQQHAIHTHRLAHWDNPTRRHRREMRSIHPNSNTRAPSEIFFFMTCFM